MRPPFSFWSCPKRECAAPGGREKGAGRAPVQWPSARDGGRRIGACSDFAWPSGTLFSSARSILPSRGGWCRRRRGGCRIASATLFAAAGCSSKKRERQRGESLRVSPTSPGQRFHQGQRVSVPDRREGQPAIPRRRQEVCACADRPAEHFFFSTGRGAFSF